MAKTYLTFTIGHKKRYRRLLARLPFGAMKARGGIVFRTRDDAERFLKVAKRPTAGIFGVDALWEEARPWLEIRRLAEPTRLINLEE